MNINSNPLYARGKSVSEEALHSKSEEHDGDDDEDMEPYLVRRLSCRTIHLPPLAFRLAEQAEWDKKGDCESPQRPTSLALRIPPLIAITAADTTR
ncbi:3',5'-cyclic-AMP phosphodiesterase 4D-like [Mantella aurantiaca]